MKSYRFDFSNGISDLASRTVAGGFSSVMDGVAFKNGCVIAGVAPSYWKSPTASDVVKVGASDTYLWSYRRKFYTSVVRRDYVGELWGSREHVYFSEYGGKARKAINGTIVDLGQDRPLDPPSVDAVSDPIGNSLKLSVIIPSVGNKSTASYTEAEITAALVPYLQAHGYPNVLVAPNQYGGNGYNPSIFYYIWRMNPDAISLMVTLSTQAIGSGGFIFLQQNADIKVYMTDLLPYLPYRDSTSSQNSTFVNPAGTLAPGGYAYRIAPIIKGVIGIPSSSMRITVPTMQDIYGQNSPAQYASSFGVKLEWVYSKFADGYAVFGRTEGKETLLIKLSKYTTTWVDDGSLAQSGDMAAAYSPDSPRPIQYLYTYVRNTNGHIDESGPSNPSSEVSGASARLVRRPGLDGRTTTYGSTVTSIPVANIVQTSPFAAGRHCGLLSAAPGNVNATVKLWLAQDSPGTVFFTTGDTVRFAGFDDSYWAGATAKVISGDSWSFYVGPDMTMPSDSYGPTGKITFDATTPASFNMDAPTMACSRIALAGLPTKDHVITVDDTLIGRLWGGVVVARAFTGTTPFKITFQSLTQHNASWAEVNDANDPLLPGNNYSNGLYLMERFWDPTHIDTLINANKWAVEGSPLPMVRSIANKTSIYGCFAYKPEIIIPGVPGVTDGDTVYIVAENSGKRVLSGNFKAKQQVGDAATNTIRIAAILDNAIVDAGTKTFTPGTITSFKVIVFPKTNGVTHWRLYRVGDVTQWSLVAEIPIDQDTYTDVIPPQRLGGPPTSAYEENGIEVIFDKPEQGMFGLTKHNGMYFGIVGNVLRWTPIGMIDAWPKTFMSNQFNYKPLKLESYGGMLFIFCEDGVYRCEGSRPTTLSFSKTSAVDGCIAPQTVKLTSRGIVYLSRRGLVIFNGVSSQPLLENRVSPEFLMSPDAVSPGVRYWMIPTLQGHFYAMATDSEPARGSDRSASREVQTINPGVTSGIFAVFHGGVYYLGYRGPDYMSHTILAVDLENPRIPCHTLPYRVLDMHVSELGELFWLVDNQAPYAKIDMAALVAQRTMGSSYTAAYTDARGIMRVGSSPGVGVAAFIRIGDDDFGYPNIEKEYDFIDVYGKGAFYARIFVDDEYIGFASGLASTTPTIDRRINMPAGIKGHSINVEIAFEDTLRMLEFGYGIVESDDANPSA